MNKILRFSFVALLAMMGMNSAFAQDIIWQEDWTGATVDVLPSKEGYTFTGTVYNDDNTIKSGTKIYDQNLAGGEAPELLVAKNGGTFSAKVVLNGKSGALTLSYKTNRNDLTVEVEGATLSEKTRDGNDDTYTVTVASGTNDITVTFKMTSNSNARLDNIKLFQGEGKKAAGLSWGTSARTVTLGANDNVFPELQNAHNLSVTYSSSETSVATISSEGTITILAAGTTVITAESAETAEYEAGKAQYTLTVKEAAGAAQEITIEKALEIINALENSKTTDEVYLIKGFVVGTPAIDKKSDGTFYGNANFYIAAEKNGSPTLYGYHIYGLENEHMNAEDYLKDGDEVIVECKLQKYVKNDNVTPEMVSGYIKSLNGQTSSVNTLKAKVDANAPAYNLKGQRVDSSYKGLIIKGGKKVIVK